MEGYKRIFTYLKFYLFVAPLFLAFLFFEIWSESSDLSLRDLRDMIIFWLIIYAVWAWLFLIIFFLYSIFLLFHKILFHIEEFIKKTKKILKIKRKKIWKYPIITQFAPPEWISVNEISYLYSIRHFKWNISCLFYKWAAEKRISLDFKEWKFLSDSVEIKILDNSLKNMPSDEVLEWNLIFGENETITLPNVDILKKISVINIQTAKTCLEKWLIEKWLSITLTPKFMKWSLVTLWILSILFLIFYAYATSFLNIFEKPSRLIPILLVSFSIIMIFWAIFMESAKKIKLIRYKLSEKWKEILAEIYWYKYFLEACDERKIKTFLKEDPEYLDKVMPYAIAIWVETEVIKNIAPKILDWTNVNRYVWNLSSTAKTMLMSSQRTIFFSEEKITKKQVKNKMRENMDKEKITKKQVKDRLDKDYQKNIKIEF